MNRKQRKNYFVEKLNQMRLGKKLLIMQIFCVIFPLLITDSFIIGILVRADQRASMQEMNNVADSVKYTINNSIESAISAMQNVYSNRYVNEFVEQEFEDPRDYYNKYIGFLKDSLYTVSINNKMYYMTIYADNKGVINGGYFQRTDSILEKEWYTQLFSENKNPLAFAEFTQINWQKQRCIYIVRRLDYNHKGSGNSVMKLEFDYNNMLQDIVNAKYSSIVYVCDGNDIILSNDGKGGPFVEFEVMKASNRARAAVHQTIRIYNRTWDIYVMPPEKTYVETILKNMHFLLPLVAMNILLPFVLMNLINLSFTQRLKELDMVFANVGKGEIYPLPDVSGKDEISELMESYNNMANRVNELIETEYKNRLKRQEINIARQKAELLALHSQINPHFLFNALESIRMHSIIKREYETADMVQKLALMQRQNVEWGNDSVKMRDEIRFIEAYLELQKYRFGDKLNYKIRVDEDCENYRVPKLTLVTFVENACIHGIENKTTPGWIFVRIYKEKDNLMLEVEDTGSGMQEEQCMVLVQGMNEASIEMLQENRRIGILNAALRLKMASEGQVHFEMESEIGVGTLVTISVPVECAEKMKLR